MRINVMNVVVGVGAGGVDELLEWQDERTGRVEPFRGWTDWGRVGLAAVGYLGQMFNFFPVIAQPLAQSETTLVTKTVVRAIRSQMGVSTQVTRAGKESRPANPAGRKVGWRPMAIGV